MSHEIRTPMNAVIGITHLLMQNAREDQAEYLKILKFSAENLLVLINDILDFNKIEAGKITFEEVDFNLKDLLLNIRAALLQKAIDKGIQLKLLMEDDLPEAVKEIR
jgi:signal transduction histidine kinase